MGGVFFSCCGLFYLNLFGWGIFFSLVVILEEKNILGVTCHVSCVTWRLLRIICPLSLTQTATVTDPPHASSPNMHSRLVCTDPKI